MTRSKPQPVTRTVLCSPTSRCGAGVGRVDITPPIGIYHRMWGAARHDRAEGVHRPLTATALVFGSADEADANLELFVAVDHCLLRPPDMETLLVETAAQTGLKLEQITVAFSHTHAGGHLVRARADMPGGELIGPYLDSLPARLAAAFRAALEAMRPAVMTYADSAVTCDLAQNRDFAWRETESGPEQFLCGLNPGAIAPLAPTVARFSDEHGNTFATLVNYACHPTTLAWDNRLISPDYVGALRETVEQATGAPCVFFLAPSGDIGPKFGFVGDVEVADRNGRQLGYAVLSALEAMGPPGCDYHFSRPVVSGATIGAWEHRPHDESRRRGTNVFRSRRWTVPLPYLAGMPTGAEGRRALEDFLAKESSARAGGRTDLAREFRALAERQRRLLERIEPLPVGDAYPFPLAAWQFGDAFWIAIEGEPYHWLAETLASRFPETPLVLIALANGIRPCYLPRREDYAKPLYEVDVTVLAPGALEALAEEIGRQMALWKEEG